MNAERPKPVARPLPRERPIALSIGGSTHAVMMASPDDLTDFAYGFLLGDGVITNKAQLGSIEWVESENGIELQISLDHAVTEHYRATRRTMAGPVGCGLCGVESLELVIPDLKPVANGIAIADPRAVFTRLREAQAERALSGALHAAAIADAAGEILAVREDIGRHNAVDKVIGHAIRTELLPHDHALVVTSRVSIDLIIKAVRAGFGTLIGRATPSDLAADWATRWGLTLIAPVFDDVYYVNGVPK